MTKIRDRDKEAEQDYWDNHPKEKKLITRKKIPKYFKLKIFIN